jgi:hypothetical protein
MSPTSHGLGSTRNYEAINRLIVSVYKIVGFIVLALIVGGLIVYIGTHAFYYVYEGWAAPAIVSPADPRVIDLNAKLAQQGSLLDKLVADRSEIELSLDAADRTIAAERRYVETLKKALSADVVQRRRELSRLSRLRSKLSSTQRDFEHKSQAFEAVSEDRLSSDYEARLIDREHLAKGTFHLAEVATAKLSLEERRVGLRGELERISREVDSLEAVTSEGLDHRSENVTYEVARAYRVLEEAGLALENAEDQREALSARKRNLERSIERYTSLMQHIEASALLKAVRQKLTVAFVPYANLTNVQKATPVFVCRAGLFLCFEVAHVVGMLEGEATARHPVFNTDLRGQLIELSFDDAEWAKEPVLHLGSPPLLF